MGAARQGPDMSKPKEVRYNVITRQKRCVLVTSKGSAEKDYGKWKWSHRKRRFFFFLVKMKTEINC